MIDLPSLSPKKVDRSKILIVDDEADVVYSIKKGLEENGSFKVDAFTDSEEVLSNFKPDLYNLLILDIRMPGISGFQLFRKIKQIDYKVKALFMTAFEIQEKEWYRVFPDMEVEGFIKKPVSIQQLIKTISEIIVPKDG